MQPGKAISQANAAIGLTFRGDILTDKRKERAGRASDLQCEMVRNKQGKLHRFPIPIARRAAASASAFGKRSLARC